MTYERSELGEFSSVVCFKAVITGVEDTLGKEGAGVVFTRAGKVRGHNLARDLGIVNSQIPVDQLAEKLNAALGQAGTRLANVVSVREENGTITVDTTETVCSAGEDMGSDRECTFTLGAIWGALEAITGKTLLGEQTGSVLRGGQYDTFVFEGL
ncbi:hypothetical protein [Deinococcus radiophilus]|uniref:Hydrocarbon-binding protein n=1 Tax=Deinococcus radiophilus TaxID=32062 RepID=A0A431W6A1_9DEIO|nr:hypothetical protein [Deinococcus radiophilus]RTR30941.1 hypothetical protein EJ104_01470 [Deinococcus radiophilus]UFA49527.1 hypothetical protein LMT64_06345 [Deinococcus radiophilus]